jgi:hypothetical protein
LRREEFMEEKRLQLKNWVRSRLEEFMRRKRLAVWSGYFTLIKIRKSLLILLIRQQRFTKESSIRLCSPKKKI